MDSYIQNEMNAHSTVNACAPELRGQREVPSQAFPLQLATISRRKQIIRNVRGCFVP